MTDGRSSCLAVEFNTHIPLMSKFSILNFFFQNIQHVYEQLFKTDIHEQVFHITKKMNKFSNIHLAHQKMPLGNIQGTFTIKLQNLSQFSIIDPTKDKKGNESMSFPKSVRLVLMLAFLTFPELKSKLSLSVYIHACP